MLKSFFKKRFNIVYWTTVPLCFNKKMHSHKLWCSVLWHSSPAFRHWPYIWNLISSLEQFIRHFHLNVLPLTQSAWFKNWHHIFFFLSWHSHLLINKSGKVKFSFRASPNNNYRCFKNLTFPMICIEILSVGLDSSSS